MSKQLFNEPPHLELLQWLARGSLKQNLLRAIRLWVWLRYLYGDSQGSPRIGNCFTYTDWRDVFFSNSHPLGENAPEFHDANCLCAKTTAEWIFDETNGVSESQWRRSQTQHDVISDSSLNKLLERRLFAVTRRSLQADLHVLAKLGWLLREDQKYYRVDEFPSYPRLGNFEPRETRQDSYNSAFVNLDLGAIAHNFSQPIGEQSRFFLEIDYIISQDNLDRVDDWQDQFRNLWQQPTVPPVKLTYNSAKVGASVRCIIYPVCLYYVQRAIYLCAFGQTPNCQGTWYNYRLDRIQNLTILEWTYTTIPHFLLQHYQQNTLPTPDYIREQMEKVWGFDFYLPPQSMVLRFDREFHDRYIQGTFRHETFQLISYQQASQLIKQHASPQHQQELLSILQSRDRQDAYYHASYRDGDTNVGMRLRAWRPYGEVFLPWKLRQKMAMEVAKEYQNYHHL